MKKLLIFLLFFAFRLQADVQLPAIIGDHMVLQQKSKVTLWGWTTNPGEEVKVTVDWDTTQYKAKSIFGHFSLQVNTPKAGGNHSITFKTNGNSITVSDVVFGEVWVFFRPK